MRFSTSSPHGVVLSILLPLVGTGCSKTSPPSPTLAPASDNKETSGPKGVGEGKEVFKTKVSTTLLRPLLTPDGKTLVLSVGDDGKQELQIVDLATKRSVSAKPSGPAGWGAFWLALSPDGKTFAAWRDAKGVRSKQIVSVIDVATGAEKANVVVPIDGVGWTVTNDGKTLIRGTKQDVILIDAATGKENRRLATFDSQPAYLVLTADEKHLVCELSGSKDKVVVLDIATGRIQHSFDPRCEWIQSVAISPDDQTVAVGTETGLRVFSRQSAKEVHFEEKKKDTICRAVAFGDDGRLLVTAWSDGSVTFHNGKSFKTIQTFHLVGEPTQIALSADGRMLSVKVERADGSTEARVYDVSSLRPSRP
jgi:WD40 repeat protein